MRQLLRLAVVTALAVAALAVIGVSAAAPNPATPGQCKKIGGDFSRDGHLSTCTTEESVSPGQGQADFTLVSTYTRETGHGKPRTDVEQLCLNPQGQPVALSACGI